MIMKSISANKEKGLQQILRGESQQLCEGEPQQQDRGEPQQSCEGESQQQDRGESQQQNRGESQQLIARRGPLKLGITGGIGSGKSVVCRVMQLLGIPVYNSDLESRRLMVSDEAIRRDLIALLGSQVYQDGALNRPLVASYLFASPDHAQRINAIVHPRVKADFRRWVAARAQHQMVAIESAILIEAGFASEVDQVVMVKAPLEVRIRRAMDRDGADRQQVMQRIARQMSEDEKRSMSHHQLLNDDKSPLIPQVLRLIALLSENID